MVKTSRQVLLQSMLANGREILSMETVTVFTKLVANIEVTLLRMSSMELVNSNGRELTLKTLIILIKVNGTKERWKAKENLLTHLDMSQSLSLKTICAIIKTNFILIHS